MKENKMRQKTNQWLREDETQTFLLVHLAHGPERGFETSAAGGVLAGRLWPYELGLHPSLGPHLIRECFGTFSETVHIS